MNYESPALRGAHTGLDRSSWALIDDDGNYGDLEFLQLLNQQPLMDVLTG